MKKLTLFAFITASQLYFSQSKFRVTDGSGTYDAAITVQSCEDGICSGKGTVVLMDKKTKKTLQTLHSNDLYFDLDDQQKPSVNVIQLYNEQSPLIFDDFNFDGTEDIAIRNGNQSSYGGPSYDVYVYNVTKKQWVLSEELTTLAYENLGMFRTDSKRKRLITFSKSGCCWHLTTEYAVIPGKGLRKVYELEEDAAGGEYVTVTTRNFINNKWLNKVKK